MRGLKVVVWFGLVKQYRLGRASKHTSSVVYSSLRNRLNTVRYQDYELSKESYQMS